MKVTYEQLVNNIRTLALSHKQVNDFGYGDPWEISKKEYKYPLVFLTDAITRLEGGRWAMGFNLLVLDKVTESESNELKVISNAFLIGGDIIGALWNPSEYYNINDKDVEARVFTNSLTDDDAGVKFDITIYVDEALNSCEAPFE